MNLQRPLLVILCAQLVVTTAVVMIFKTVEDRSIAAVLASTLFILLGLLIVLTGLRLQPFRRLLTFWVGLAHLLLASLPMFVVRVLNFGVEFSQLSVLGIPGPFFHKLSEGLSAALLASVIIDLVRARLRKKPA